MGKKHQRLWPEMRAFQAEVPSGSMWMPVPDLKKNCEKELQNKLEAKHCKIIVPEIELAKHKATGKKEKISLPWRPNDNPSVGRPLCLPTILKQVISEIKIES